LALQLSRQANIADKPLRERGKLKMSREIAMLKSLSFCLALIMSVPAMADHAVPVEIIGSVGIDGSGAIQEAGVVQVMFKGKTPPHGFQLCASPQPTDTLFFSDVGPGPFDNVAFFELQPGQCYTTPLGYRPPGPVSIYAENRGVTFHARMW
jgi:hypothetical protein